LVRVHYTTLQKQSDMRYGLYLLAMVTIIASCAQPDQPATVTVNLANAKAKAIYIIKNDFRKKIEVTDGVASDTMMKVIGRLHSKLSMKVLQMSKPICKIK